MRHEPVHARGQHRCRHQAPAPRHCVAAPAAQHERRRASGHGARRPRRLRPCSPAVPPLRHAGRGATARPASAHDVLVSKLPTAPGYRIAYARVRRAARAAAMSRRRASERARERARPCDRDRRRVRWAGGHQATGQGRCRRHHRRSPQLPHVPTAAVRSRNRGTQRRRRRVRRSRHLPSSAQRHVPERDRHGCRTGRSTHSSSTTARSSRSSSTTSSWPQDRPRRTSVSRAQPSTRFRSMRSSTRSAAQSHPRTVRGGRRRSVVDRRRRADVRGRRRWRDRRRGLGCDVRAVRDGDAQGLPLARRRQGASDPARDGRCPAAAVLRSNHSVMRANGCEDMGVDVRTGEAVTRVTPTRVVLGFR